MKGRARIVISRAEAGERLDRVLAARGEWGTRSQIKHLLSGGRVLVGSRPAKAAHVARAGEEVTVLPPPAVSAAVAPAAIPLDVLYEDECLAVINKPPGVVVHPGAGRRAGTLADAMRARWGFRGPGDSERAGIVHRLDKDTSGALLVAKDLATLEALSAAFAARAVRKEYVALVYGRPPAPRGRIEMPVGRHPRERRRMSVRSRRPRPAATAYEVVETGGGVSLLRLLPETGRTHQLRVHCAARGFPIVGDRTYGRRGALRVIGDPAVRELLGGFPRQALHARRLVFPHPRRGGRVAVAAPLAADLAGLLAQWRLLRQAAPRALDNPTAID